MVPVVSPAGRVWTSASQGARSGSMKARAEKRWGLWLRITRRARRSDFPDAANAVSAVWAWWCLAPVWV